MHDLQPGNVKIPDIGDHPDFSYRPRICNCHFSCGNTRRNWRWRQGKRDVCKQRGQTFAAIIFGINYTPYAISSDPWKVRVIWGWETYPRIRFRFFMRHKQRSRYEKTGKCSENENRYTRTRRASHAQGLLCSSGKDPITKDIWELWLEQSNMHSKDPKTKTKKKKRKTKQKLFEFVAFRGLCFLKRTACVSRSNRSRLSILVSLSFADPFALCLECCSSILTSVCQSERAHSWPSSWLLDLCGQISHAQ